jgi:hypothetical protein
MEPADQEVELVELVRTSCSHYILRPPAWRDPDASVGLVATPFGLQAKMDQIARELGTRYFQLVAQNGLVLRTPVILCPECDQSIRRQEAARTLAPPVTTAPSASVASSNTNPSPTGSLQSQQPLH